MAALRATVTVSSSTCSAHLYRTSIPLAPEDKLAAARKAGYTTRIDSRARKRTRKKHAVPVKRGPRRGHAGGQRKAQGRLQLPLVPGKKKCHAKSAMPCKGTLRTSSSVQVCMPSPGITTTACFRLRRPGLRRETCTLQYLGAAARPPSKRWCRGHISAGRRSAPAETCAFLPGRRATKDAAPKAHARCAVPRPASASRSRGEGPPTCFGFVLFNACLVS